MNHLLKFLLVSCLMILAGLQDLQAQYDKDVFYFRGRQALADGKYALAIENFNILSQLDTADYYTFFFRGIAKYNLGDLRGAKRDFDRSVRINPVFTSGYHYRGITESRFGNYDAALADLQRAIDLRPGYEGIYFSRGVTYFLAQQFETAIKDFDKYIRKEPKDPSAYLNRGASYLFLGDTLKAVADYNKAIKLDRFDPEGYVRRGRLYASQKNYEAFLEMVPENRMAQIGLQSAKQSADWKKNPSRYIVKKAKELNGQRSDFCPAYVGEDTTMIVTTSTRKDATGDEISGITGQECADLFITKRDEKGKWQKTERIDGDVNGEDEDGACAFTPDGKMMYFTRCTSDPESPRYAAIYKSSRSDAAWGKAEPVNISNDTLSAYAHPAVSPDGEWLYFTSNMAGGEGGLDIWRMYIGPVKSKEGVIENLGDCINTEGDEQFPTFGPKGELFFSSDGHPGMGGLDIFCATFPTDTTVKTGDIPKNVVHQTSIGIDKKETNVFPKPIIFSLSALSLRTLRINASFTIASLSSFPFKIEICSFISCNSAESKYLLSIMICYYLLDIFFNSSFMRNRRTETFLTLIPTMAAISS